MRKAHALLTLLLAFGALGAAESRNTPDQPATAAAAPSDSPSTASTVPSVVQKGDEQRINAYSDFDSASVLELLQLLDDTNGRSREIRDQIQDLHLYSRHIDVVLSDLIEADFVGQVGDLFDSARNAVSRDHKSPFEAFQDLEKKIDEILGRADGYSLIAERPAGKTTVVREHFDSRLDPIGDSILRKTEPLRPPLRTFIASTVNAKTLDGIDRDGSERRAAYQTTLQEYTNRLRDALRHRQVQIAEVLKPVETDRDATDARIRLLRQAIGKRVESRQDAFVSVNYMLVVLVTMFVVAALARYFAARLPANNLFAMIDERTLVEFGGMAFLLLAILILGNTDKLDKQALGPLIGTIAGYIFGKGMANIARSSEREVSSVKKSP